MGFHGVTKSNLWLWYNFATFTSYKTRQSNSEQIIHISHSQGNSVGFHKMHISLALSIYFYQACYRKACNLDMSWYYSVALEKLCVSTYSTSCCQVSNQWHFPEQQLRTGKWKVVNNRVDTTTVCFENPQVILKWHKGSLAGCFSTTAERACACWARLTDLPWCILTDTLPSGGKELGGRGMNRSDNSQWLGVGRGDGCSMVDDL